MLIIIDNYDSFTYNLVQYFGELGQAPTVYRNDEISVEELQERAPDFLVISPGPGRPDQAGISKAAIQAFTGKIPILGVCLGHQSIGEVFGGATTYAPEIMHGKTSAIHHSNHPLFQNIDNPFIATRYHSLVIDPNTLPDCLERICWTEDQIIMGVSHKEHPTYGLQFHPESILTEAGKQLLKNFLNTAP